MECCLVFFLQKNHGEGDKGSICPVRAFVYCLCVSLVITDCFGLNPNRALEAKAIPSCCRAD